jgi:hypothetical protein
MFYSALEFFTRTYYLLKNKINSCLFTELSIIPLYFEPLKYVYYYYLLNYFLCNYIELLLNFFGCSTYYHKRQYYEMTYRDNNVIRTSILNGTINDVFTYTRKLKEGDRLILLLKANIILKDNDQKINIRNIVKKYDTKTKLYDIIKYNFYNEVYFNNISSIEIGRNTYTIENLDRNLNWEDA